jgi:hypothetical protein
MQETGALVVRPPAGEQPRPVTVVLELEALERCEDVDDGLVSSGSPVEIDPDRIVGYRESKEE